MTWKEFKNKWIVADEEDKGTKYADVREMIKSMNSREAFLEKWYWRFYRGIVKPIKDFPYDVKYYVRMWYQRAKNGWAESDAWGFDWYLARVIVEGCEWLKKNKHGCPSIEGFDNYDNDDKQFDAMCAEWDRILDCIIWTFKMAQHIQEDHFSYVPSSQWTQEKFDKYNAIWIGWEYQPPPRALTLEECKKYEEGWVYFQKYFFSLWD